MFNFVLNTYHNFNNPDPEPAPQEPLPENTQENPQQYITPEDILVANLLDRVINVVKQKYPDAEQLLAHYFLDKMRYIVDAILDYMSTEDLYEDDITNTIIEEFCEDELIGFAEVKIDFYDETEKCYTVDAWMTDDESEEGEVVARVYENKVVFVMDDVNLYLDVMRAIQKCKNNF